MSGFEAVEGNTMGGVLTSSQDWGECADFYNRALKNGTLFEQTANVPRQVPAHPMDLICRGPIQYTAFLGS